MIAGFLPSTVLGCLGFQNDMLLFALTVFHVRDDETTCGSKDQAEMLGHQTDAAKAEDKAKSGGETKV